MKKSDLKTGMWVKTIYRFWMVVVIDNEPFLIHPNGWMPIKTFPRACSSDSEFDILKVYDYHADFRVEALQYNIWEDCIETSCDFKEIWPAPPKETIKIGETTYDKAEFEEAVKSLKPIK